MLVRLVAQLVSKSAVPVAALIIQCRLLIRIPQSFTFIQNSHEFTERTVLSAV